MTQMDTDGGPQADFVDERELLQIERKLKENNSTCTVEKC